MSGALGPSRADPFDLGDFQPTAPKGKPEAAAIRQVSEANHFPSRSAATKPAPGVVAEPAPVRRRRTGRNVQFNIKATQETIDRFARIADANGWVFGEALERALDALESKLEATR